MPKSVPKGVDKEKSGMIGKVVRMIVFDGEEFFFIKHTCNAMGYSEKKDLDITHAIQDYLDSEKHQKQYANREELVEEIEKWRCRKLETTDEMVAIDSVVRKIKTHGLEE